jgi:tetratricopeptide (TPR) repeat protein
VAFGMQRLGARFAMPREDIVTVLDEARRAVTDDPATGAQLTAAMARELHHSVADDRPRAALLSEEALELARRTEDPATLALCLLARHDVLWTPGTAPERLDLAREIVELATELGDEERRAEGLLLTANALLEMGSPAFRPALATYLASIDALAQPRHRYLALTRRGALALIDGRVDDAAALIDEAASFGERIGEPDAGNVRMSQLLELIRARGDADEQRAFATEAVRWWVGAPVHAHAVAAGFLARAGDLPAARRHVHTVLELGSWQADRSYLSSVLIGNLVTAAIALDDTDLCGELLDELRPIAASCGVNGAVVAFSGSHAHFAGLAATALGRTAEATSLLDQAIEVHDRLGAAAWEAESRAALELIRGQTPTMLRRDARWNITYRHEAATVPDVKGLRDLATLLSRPGVDVHVLELVDAPVARGGSIEMADRKALVQYRQRLADLDDDRAEAEQHRDTERGARAEAEHEALLDELRTVTGLGGAARLTGAHASERARKAVSARIKDAIRRLETPMPQLAAHLDEAIVTGAWCRYRSEMADTWTIET